MPKRKLDDASAPKAAKRSVSAGAGAGAGAVARPQAELYTAKPGGARNAQGKLVFEDAPACFQPTLTPKEIFQAGAMGGGYFRNIHQGDPQGRLARV